MKSFDMFLASVLAATAVFAESSGQQGESLFKVDNFNKMEIEVCEDAAIANFKTNCLMDCSVFMAKKNKLTPAKITVTNNVLQIDCPSNGFYKLKLKVAADFIPGRNYRWSFTCWQRALIETQKHEAVVSYKIDDMGEEQSIIKGFSITKNIVLTGGGYHVYTFIISIPDGGAVQKRALDFEITNENLKDTGGIIKIKQMELKQEFNENQVYDLWPSLLPPGQKEVLPNQAYIDGNGRYYRDISRPTLIVYQPAENLRQKVGVIICSGGSYHLLESMKKNALWLNSMGITAFELQYRVPSKSNEPQKALQDAQRALRLVRSKAAELKIDNLGIMGESAGAHLAIMTATNFERNSYNPIDAIDKFNCRPDFVISIALPYALKQDGTISDNIRIDDKTPSVFLAHGDADNACSPINSTTLYAELYKRKIPAELHIWSKAGHSIGVSSEIGKEWSGLCEKWLKTMGIIKP